MTTPTVSLKQLIGLRMFFPSLRIILFQDALAHRCLFGAAMTTWAWVAIHVSLKQYGQFLTKVLNKNPKAYVDVAAQFNTGE